MPSCGGVGGIAGGSSNQKTTALWVLLETVEDGLVDDDRVYRRLSRINWSSDAFACRTIVSATDGLSRILSRSNRLRVFVN